MPRLLQRLLPILFICLITLLLLEILLRLAAPLLPRRLAIAIHYVQTGERYEQERTTGSTLLSGRYGYALMPGLDNVLVPLSPSVSVHVTTTALWGGEIGFRTPSIDYFVDAVFVGDSHTFCFTEYADCWVSRFAEDTGLGVVNLGQPGTGGISHARILEDFARPLTPRLVIWQFFGNDFNEDYGFAVLLNEIEPIEDEETPHPIDSTPPLLSALRRHSALFATLETVFYGEWAYISDYEQLFVAPYTVTYRDGALQFGQPYSQLVMDVTRPRNTAGIPLTRAAIEQGRAATESWGGNFVVVIIPTPSQVYAHLTAPILGEAAMLADDSPRQMMLAICEEMALRCLDVLPYLQARAQAGEHLFYTDDGHLNPHGNAVLAEIVSGWLGGEGLLYAAP